MRRSWSEIACLGFLAMVIACEFLIDGFDYHPRWIGALVPICLICAAVLAPLGVVLRAKTGKVEIASAKDPRASLPEIRRRPSAEKTLTKSRLWSEYTCVGFLAVGIVCEFLINGVDYHPRWIGVLLPICIICAAALALLGVVLRARVSKAEAASVAESEKSFDR
jgi:hypothetical protein